MDFERLVTAVEEITGQQPTSIATVLGNVATLKEARHVNANNHSARILAAATGTYLDKPKAAKLWQDIAAESILATETMTLIGSLEQQVTQHLERILTGQPGTDLIELLRPAFNTALEGVLAAAEYYDNNTTAAQIVERGPKAVQAWQAATAHQRVLDTIYDRVLYLLTHQVAVLPADAPSLTLQPLRLPAVWLVGTDRPDIDGVGLIMVSPNASFPVPAGRWIEAIRRAPLHLNSPAEAIEVLRVIRDGRAAEERERQNRGNRAGAALAARA